MPLTLTDESYKKLLIPFSFIVMLLAAYAVDPHSLEEAWKGRVFYLFFLWLFTLEFILGGKTPKIKTSLNQEWARIILAVFVLMIPTIYIVETSVFGLNTNIAEIGRFLGIEKGWQLDESWPFSIEYIIVATSIFIGVLILLGLEGVKQFSISIFLLGMMGVFYMIDTIRPYTTAAFPTFLFPTMPQYEISIQSFVPFTSSMVAFVLEKLGYVIQMVVYPSGAVHLIVNNAHYFLIFWPCAGIHSLFIYTFVILLFLKDSRMSLGAKITCLGIGAAGTFFVNVLRIVSIINISVTVGDAAGEYFHNYYGELFFLGWIVFYLFALIFVQRAIANRSMKKNTETSGF